MAEHAHTPPTPTPPIRWATFPAPTTIHLRLSRTEDDGLPLAIDWRDGYATLPGHPALPLTVDWTGVITPDLRRRVERDVNLLIALLDALDASGQDLEEGDPAECGGDPEWSGDECEPSDVLDPQGGLLTVVHGGVPAMIAAQVFRHPDEPTPTTRPPMPPLPWPNRPPKTTRKDGAA
jgi:hypothetical protein